MMDFLRMWLDLCAPEGGRPIPKRPRSSAPPFGAYGREAGPDFDDYDSVGFDDYESVGFDDYEEDEWAEDDWEEGWEEVSWGVEDPSSKAGFDAEDTLGIFARYASGEDEDEDEDDDPGRTQPSYLGRTWRDLCSSTEETDASSVEWEEVEEYGVDPRSLEEIRALAVQVVSSRPVRTTLALAPGFGGGSWNVGELVPLDRPEAVAAIRKVDLSWKSSGPGAVPYLCVVVPDDLPQGRYRASVSEDRTLMGYLNLEVLDTTTSSSPQGSRSPTLETETGETETGETETGETETGETETGETETGETDANESDASESEASESEAGEAENGETSGPTP